MHHYESIIITTNKKYHNQVVNPSLKIKNLLLPEVIKTGLNKITVAFVTAA